MEIGEILKKHGLLTDQQLSATRDQANGSGRLDQIAVELGFVTEEAALRAVGTEVGLDYIDLADADVDLTLLQAFPKQIMHREAVFPVCRKDGSLVVATSDPTNLYAIDEIASETGASIEPVLANRIEIQKLIKTHFGVGSETISGLLKADEEKDEDDVQFLDDVDMDGSELSEMIQEPSVIRLVNEILVEALEARTSDVHIESQEAGLKVRYRIDGILQRQPVPPEINRYANAIVSRLKIMARLNIAEKRLPQDGRIKLRVSGREVDVRVSVIPMIHGEGIVMRILDKGRMKFDLKSLGMEDDQYAIFHDVISRPHGIILVTGPTGSGKTTTLYSALEEIKSEGTKIITTEDPVEYQLPGINQIQVHSKIGFTFSASLRAILRHDPDIVLVGEIRDLETAENAIQASLTGHLVFSTLHTNDAASAYTRLVDMGVEPFLVASTVEAVMAQRLVRTLCNKCKEAYKPNLDELPPTFPKDKLTGDLFQPGGCKDCRHTGYAGRVGICELMVTSEAVRELAQDRASSWKVRNAAIKDGMIGLQDDGWRKVLAGKTTVDEVLRVAKGH
ncbi:MAG: Flp pilus assembly complex ATPase component TadA [Pirellulales bacterium]|nr:Flp pilus assembly complex ATPase component TadA [Pirellulales bacterium]